jgi:hypothetical protein
MQQNNESARAPCAPSRRRAGRRAVPGSAARALFLVCLLGCCGLLASACGNSDDTTKPQPPQNVVAPADVFSQRAPEKPAPQTCRLLVVGDSLSISLGEQLERALTDVPGLDFARDGTRSTGLTRPELLDWPTHLRERVAREAPDVVLIMIGANDVMPVEAADGTRLYFDSPGWTKAYAAKARGLVDICRQANPGVRVYWIGVPTMGEASLAAGVKQVNAALATMCADAPGCRFIDTQAAFADASGRFSRHGRDAATGEMVLLRTADGVHMTESGSKLLAGAVLAAVSQCEPLPPSSGADELRTFARDVRPVADPAPESPREQQKPKVRPGNKTYVVKKGDTILGIARKLGIPAADLAAVNPDADSNRLSLGQVLRLPAKKKR